MEKILIEILIFALPLMVFFLRMSFPNNQLITFFIPKLLQDKEYPKSQFRRSGVAYIALGVWFFSVIFITVLLYPKFPMEKYMFITALLFFVFPILFLTSLVIGGNYLLLGIFGKKENIRPRLESLFYAEKNNLAWYIKKLHMHTLVNLSSLFALIISLPIEYFLGIGENGLSILFNVSLLITFILTFRKMRTYIIKSASFIDLSENKYLLSTLTNPLGIFVIHWHSFCLIKKFNESMRQGNPPIPQR